MPQLNRTGRKASTKKAPKPELGAESESEIQQAINQAKGTDKGKVLLRVDRNTTILVSPAKATREYADEYRERANRP